MPEPSATLLIEHEEEPEEVAESPVKLEMTPPPIFTDRDDPFADLLAMEPSPAEENLKFSQMPELPVEEINHSPPSIFAPMLPE
jgi:hypothetical protein